MFNEAEPPCSYDFDVLFSLKADPDLQSSTLYLNMY